MKYRVFGLTMLADRVIPGLVAEKFDLAAVDVMVTLGSLPENFDQVRNMETEELYFISPERVDGEPQVSVGWLASGNCFHFRYATGVEFVLAADGRAVWGNWPGSLGIAEASLYLLGPVLGFLLRLRGSLCLHASAVVVKDRAFAVTGPSGAGKSTLAALFAAKGFAVLTDDVLPLETEASTFIALPGYHRLRLFADSVNNIPGLPSRLPLLIPDWDKCYLELNESRYRFHSDRVKLAAIYVLERGGAGATVAAEPLPDIKAVVSLAANTYRNELLDRKMRSGEFYCLGRLVKNISVRRLFPGNGFADLPELYEYLLDDFQAQLK